MQIKTRVIRNGKYEIKKTVTLSELKAFIRAAKAKGYTDNNSYFAPFFINVHSGGGIGLLLNTVRDHDTFEIYLDKTGV